MATTNKATKVEFIQYHRPNLTDGDYTLTLEQKIKGSGISAGDHDSFGASMQFSVLGDRYNINPSLVSEVFPQAGGLGAYSNVLPHLILNRSTLPWERYAKPGDKSVPWLALLVFEEDELGNTTKLSKLNGCGITEAQYAQYQKTGVASMLYETFQSGGKGPVVGWPALTPESGDNGKDRLQILDVSTDTLKKIMPDGKALSYLTHVRQATAEDDTLVGKEKAVIIANRLPQAGKTTVVHLVSLEGRLDSSSSAFTYPSTPYTRLISLHQWHFSCIKQNQTFSGLLLQLNHQTLFNLPATTTNAKALNAGSIPTAISEGFANAGASLSINAKVTAMGLWDISDRDYHYIVDTNRNVYDGSGVKLFTLASERLTNGKVPQTMLKKFNKTHNRPLLKSALAAKRTNAYWWITDGTKEYFLQTEQGQMEAIRLFSDRKPTLRLPQTGNTKADKLLENGFVPLPHQLRKGGHTVSWYRSPLATVIPTQEIDPEAFPVHSADELMRYDQKIGMLDVSYSVAWELGRLLMLKNKLASVALWEWKRHHKQLVDSTRQQEQQPHLAQVSQTDDSTTFPKAVSNYLSDLSLLKNVPFNYLVPDARQLPKESIRYFNIDPGWVASLIDGAFSIGRHTHADKARDKQHRSYLESLTTYKGAYSGFIMRSAVVKGWPGLEVDGFPVNGVAAGTNLEILRMDRLSADTLLVIFKGQLNTLDIHLKPEHLHFGVDIDPTDITNYTKTFRDGAGNQNDNVFLSKVPLSPDRKVDIVSMYNYAKTNCPTVKTPPPPKPPPPPPIPFTGFSAAQFAVSMIEGVQKVRFISEA